MGITTGMAFVGGQLYGVSNSGMFYAISTGTGRASDVVNLGPSFAGLTAGPQNLQDGAYANMLFAVDTNGNLHALNTSGQPQGVFAGGASSVSTNRLRCHRPGLFAGGRQLVASDDAASGG